MTPLNLIYAIKICLGALTAVLCIVLGIRDIFNAIAIGLIVYLGSDRILRQIFIERVEKQSVVTKTGIGIYILTWLFLWILLYTFIKS